MKVKFAMVVVTTVVVKIRQSTIGVTASFKRSVATIKFECWSDQVA